MNKILAVNIVLVIIVRIIVRMNCPKCTARNLVICDQLRNEMSKNDPNYIISYSMLALCNIIVYIYPVLPCALAYIQNPVIL